MCQILWLNIFVSFYLRCFLIKLIHAYLKIFAKTKKQKEKKLSLMKTPDANTGVNLFLNLFWIYIIFRGYKNGIDPKLDPLSINRKFIFISFPKSHPRQNSWFPTVFQTFSLPTFPKLSKWHHCPLSTQFPDLGIILNSFLSLPTGQVLLALPSRYAVNLSTFLRLHCDLPSQATINCCLQYCNSLSTCPCFHSYPAARGIYMKVNQVLYYQV